MSQIDLGARWEDVLAEMNVPPGVAEFVNETLRCAIHGSLVEVASFFFFGREDVIPEMFERLLKSWGNAKAEVPHFAYYLQRHIELDGDSHGPWAREMLTALAGQSESNWKEATSAAERAITSRIKLWDSVLAHLKNTEKKRGSDLLANRVTGCRACDGIEPVVGVCERTVLADAPIAIRAAAAPAAAAFRLRGGVARRSMRRGSRDRPTPRVRPAR